MPRRFGLPLLMLVVALAPACRQADGSLPAADGDVPNRLSDISKDISHAAGGDADAPRDLADDLKVFAEDGSDHAAVDELARRVSAILAGKRVTEDMAQPLARQLWIAVAGRDLSDKQVEALQTDTRTALTTLDVPEDGLKSVSDQVVVVQKAVTARQRRWYELF